MRTWLSLFLLFGAALLGGCAKSAAGPSETEVVPAAVYKANRGLQVSPAAAGLFAVKTGEVSTRDVGVTKGVAAIPAEALLRTVKGDFVYVANGGWFLRTPVTIGAMTSEWCEVKEGLYEGDAIVVHGTNALWLAELQAINGGGDDDDH